MKRSSPRIALAAIALMALPAAGQAQERPDYVDSSRAWHAFQFEENGNRVCYIASRPEREEGNYTRRGDVFVLVTHRPAEGSRDVVSFYAGYPFGEEQNATATVDGGRAFPLFTEGENAWSPDPDTDQQLVAAMRAGGTMVVRGTSSRGTLTTDTYSLLGFTAMHNLINENCSG